MGKDCVEEIQGEKTMELEERRKKNIKKIVKLENVPAFYLKKHGFPCARPVLSAAYRETLVGK